MIKNRPASLLADAVYGKLPKPPFALDWASIPELIRIAILDLGGIQPITMAMAEASGGELRDKPSTAEIELFRQRDTKFQLISIVLSCIPAGQTDGNLRLLPFAMSLIPASKRGKVDQRTIDEISQLDVHRWLETKPIYVGYDPFSGDWSMYGNLHDYLDGGRKGYFDEIGLVVDQFFLATETPVDDEVITIDLKMPSEQMKVRYEKHRNKLFFTPFKKIEARRVWGAETPIELFVLQALAKENLFPECQILIMGDGATFPSFYHLWKDIEFRHSKEPVTEVDLFFPDKRVAVFCDGAHHNRSKQKQKDNDINAKLEALGIRPVRIPSYEINNDLPSAIKKIRNAL